MKTQTEINQRIKHLQGYLKTNWGAMPWVKKKWTEEIEELKNVQAKMDD